MSNRRQRRKTKKPNTNNVIKARQVIDASKRAEEVQSRLDGVTVAEKILTHNIGAGITKIVEDLEGEVMNGDGVPPEELLTTSVIEIPVTFNKGTDSQYVEIWLFNFSELSPVQWMEARKILLYEHSLEVNRLPSHFDMKQVGAYRIEQDAFTLILIKRNPDGTLWRYSEEEADKQRAAARKALSNMTGADYSKLMLIKKNFCSLMNIPSDERTKRFKDLVTLLGTTMYRLTQVTPSITEELREYVKNNISEVAGPEDNSN